MSTPPLIPVFAVGAGSVPSEYVPEMDADAFEEPLESWTPAAEDGSGVGFVSMRHMRTPGTAPRGNTLIKPQPQPQPQTPHLNILHLSL